MRVCVCVFPHSFQLRWLILLPCFSPTNTHIHFPLSWIRLQKRGLSSWHFYSFFFFFLWNRSSYSICTLTHPSTTNTSSRRDPEAEPWPHSLGWWVHALPVLAPPAQLVSIMPSLHTLCVPTPSVCTARDVAMCLTHSLTTGELVNQCVGYKPHRKSYEWWKISMTHLQWYTAESVRSLFWLQPNTDTYSRCIIIIVIIISIIIISLICCPVQSHTRSRAYPRRLRAQDIRDMVPVYCKAHTLISPAVDNVGIKVA